MVNDDRFKRVRTMEGPSVAILPRVLIPVLSEIKQFKSRNLWKKKEKIWIFGAFATCKLLHFCKRMYTKISLFCEVCNKEFPVIMNDSFTTKVYNEYFSMSHDDRYNREVYCKHILFYRWMYTIVRWRRWPVEIWICILTPRHSSTLKYELIPVKSLLIKETNYSLLLRLKSWKKTNPKDILPFTFITITYTNVHKNFWKWQQL